MLLRLQPKRDERAALAFLDLASALDAGLPAATFGGDPKDGDDMVALALQRRGAALDPTDDIVLRAAWRAGRPSEALRRLAAQRQQRAEFARPVLAGFLYPIALVSVAFVVSLIAARIGVTWLPWVVGLLIVAIAAMLAFVIGELRTGGRRLQRVPVFGAFLRDLGEVPYLDVLHACHASGVPLLKAHQEAVAACPVHSVRERLLVADALVQQGRPIAESLAQAIAVCSETQTMLATGEQTGTLEDALRRAAQRRRDTAQRGATQIGKGLAVGIYVVGLGVAALTVVSFYAGYGALLRGLRPH